MIMIYYVANFRGQSSLCIEVSIHLNDLLALLEGDVDQIVPPTLSRMLALFVSVSTRYVHYKRN